MATLSARSILLKTQLGKDALLPRVISGTERVSTPFRFDVGMLSEKGDLNPDQVLGKDLSVSFALPSGGKRYFHGIVTEFAQLGYRSKYHEYHAVVRPWFWQLTRTSDCRIFQKKSVPDIFEEVVKQYGFSGYKLRLKDKGVYKKWDYCVQYRETDFNFLSRLLEQEGIYYFFEHSESSHLMVLADDAGAHQTVEKYDSVPFFPPDAKAQRDRDHLSSWSFTKSMLPGAYATTDYDFVNPRQSLLSTESIARQHALANYEVFDYPAELSEYTSAESARIAKTRIQEAQSGYMLASGKGDAAGLATGRRFKLAEYPRKDLNIEYVIVGTSFSLASDAYDAGGGGDEAEFQLSLEAVDAKTPYRPARVTPKPTIHGSQTAVVVGPGGEEIYTDEHARVKVQFHWDRYGKLDENSSCWVRVSQVWAGKNWGAIHIPRIGQEVVVSFLEGDPDQPIITGRVYNGDNTPPYALPANKTQSGIKSRSSKGGAAANFNEIRFEDLKGSEQLFIHAEKNQDIEVEKDETHWVGHDRKKTVDNDETTLVKGNRTENVDKDETITVNGNRTETVEKNETISITKNREESVGDNESVTIGKDQSLTVEGNRTRDVTKDEKVTIGKKHDITVGDSRKTNVTKDDALTVGKKLLIDAGDQVVIQTGSASITMKKDGTITIKGKDITLDGSGKINIKASSDVIIKGSKVTQN